MKGNRILTWEVIFFLAVLNFQVVQVQAAAKEVIIDNAGTDEPEAGQANGKVEIFANGKSYSSVEEYRSRPQEGEKKPGLSVNETPSGALPGLDGGEAPPFAVPSVTQTVENSLNEIQGMLKNFYSQHTDEDPVTINPEKIKTIDIKPTGK